MSEIHDLYIAAKRAFFNRPFIREVKKDSEEYFQLEELSKKLDGISAPYDKYIRFIVHFFSKFHKFPTTKMLLADKSINAFRVHQSMKNIYVEDLYTLDGDFLIVQRTWRKYPIRQVQLPINDDAVATKVVHSLTDKKLQIIEDFEYFMAKMAYKKRMLTDAFIKAYEELNEETNT
jgi:hypothetical protein